MPRRNQPRRHHNTKGMRQMKSGASFRRLVKFAHKLGLKVEGEKEIEQLRGGYECPKEPHPHVRHLPQKQRHPK